jgi:hypothetical protein
MPKAKIPTPRHQRGVTPRTPHLGNQQSSTPRAVNATSPLLLRVRVRGIAGSPAVPAGTASSEGLSWRMRTIARAIWSSASGAIQQSSLATSRSQRLYEATTARREFTNLIVERTN